MKRLALLVSGFLVAACVTDRQMSECENEMKLDGKWSFKLLSSEKECPADNFWSKDFDVSQWNLIDVPSCWEMKGFGKPLYDEKISGESGLYVRRFTLPDSWPQDGIVRIRFEGVMFGAKVWVNGREAGSFTSSFNANELDITPFVNRGGENTIAVRTNAHPKGAEFDTNDDWTLHGIFRSVVVFHRPQLHLAKWRISTKVDGRNALVSIESELSQKGSVETRIFDSSGRLVTSSAGATAGAKANAKMTVKDARFWSAEAPELYNLEFIVRNENGRICETRRSKVGLREISWNGGVLKVNGMPVKLRGVNHHDLSHVNGRAITDAEQRRDAELIKAANCNFIRTSHYPPSKALLDACDELGIYVMDEVPFGLGNRFLDDSSFGPILLERAELTLARDMNRACVIIWSVGNENHITPISLATAKKVRKLDSSRPWCFPMQPREFLKELEKRPVSELGDLVNWHYPAICGEPDELKSKYFSRFDRPYLSGEYAHAYGLDFGLLEWYWSEMMWNDPSYAGGAVWMFNDQGIIRKVDDMTAEELENCVWPDSRHVWDSAGSRGTDGVVYADRTPQSDYFEMRKVYAPVRLAEPTESLLKGRAFSLTIPVENRQDTLSLNDGLVCGWKLFADRRQVASGSVKLPAVVPHGKGVLEIAGNVPEADASLWRVEIAFCRRRDGKAVYERSYPLNISLPAPTASPRLTLRFDEASKQVVFLGEGKELLRTPVVARVDRRPMLSKDRKTKQFDRWTPNALEPSQVKVVSSSESSLVLELCWKPEEFTLKEKTDILRELHGKVSFTVEDCRVRVGYSLSYACERRLVETGIALQLPGKFKRFDWVGLGPYECYPLASTLSEFGIWALNRDDLYFSGNRRDVRLLLASSDDGGEVAVVPSAPADIAFERRGENTLVAHNAFVAGKACKFNEPRTMGDLKAGDKLEGSFYFLPQVKKCSRLDALFGERIAVKPFMPFYRTYDF
ncbi:MAG: hypothetical protein E7046_11035 [Lentisphaerae bacterium]|nr:hypothetical protein [Lentisphaerota bacterium]